MCAAVFLLSAKKKTHGVCSNTPSRAKLKPQISLRASRSLVITSGARSAERVLWFKGEISVCAAQPDPTRPHHLRSLYLWNALTDSRAVFFVRCHHSINFVYDRYRYPPVPATARGTCRGEGVQDTLSLGYSTTAGPIAFKFGV